MRAAADYSANTFAQYTRDIVKDYEEQTPKQPQTTVRSILRLTLVAVLAIFLLTVLILFFTVGAPAVRTTRRYGDTLVNYLKQQESSFGRTSDTWLCPCQSQVSFSDFMTINLTRSPDDPGRQLQVDDNSYYNAPENLNVERYHTCYNVTTRCQNYRPNTSTSQSGLACETMLSETMTPRGTVIPFNYVTRPSIVWQAAASQAQTVLLQILPYRQEFDTSAYQTEWKCIEDLLTVLSFTWSLVASNGDAFPNATSFWERSTNVTSAKMPYDAVWSYDPYNSTLGGELSKLPTNTTPPQNFTAVSYQPVMPVVHFGWSAFIDACDVPYCDVTRRPTFWYKAFVAFSQIGGFSTVAVVIVRLVLWPLCTCNWRKFKSHQKATRIMSVRDTQLSTVGSGAPLFAGPPSRTDPV